MSPLSAAQAPLPTPMSATLPQHLRRRVVVVLAAVLFHLGALWALQSGLLSRAVELVIPVQVLAEFIEQPRPQIEPPPPAPSVAAPTPPQPKPKPRPVPQPLPQPVAALTSEPSALAPVVPPSPPAPPAESVVAAAAPATATAAPPAPPAAPRVELPSSSADYLNNPRPPYPPLSRRLGEQGQVVVRVFIGVDGTASRAEVRQSSGFERLDQTALQTVLRWRYVPGKRAGVPEAMWFNVPISFVLE